MGIIGDGLDAATARATRPIPKSAGAQVRFLVKQLKGSTRDAARVLGVSQRTIERYVKDQIRRPRAELAARLEGEVRRRWQPRVQARARKRAATTDGLVIYTRARFGFDAPIGSSDDSRIRNITQAIPPEWADRLFTAQDQGASEQQIQQILGDALGQVYFRDGGNRADGLGVRFADIDFAEISI
ncbi:telomere-protecting terminal protein Tpg [Streptomyces rubiginosohelvolus]|uniref:telomere-protecting terminal protein Tpg n=1 Tax=Streptomyces rubiginosohelvolus TaxID=67362 RepID=UPI003669CA80